MAAISETVTRYTCMPDSDGCKVLKSKGMAGWRELRDKAPDWDSTLFSIEDAEAKAKRLTEVTGITFYGCEFAEV